MDWIALGAMAALAAIVHLGWLLHFAPRQPIGDEADYLRRGHWPDPHRPERFLRVPLMPWLARWMTRHSAQPEPALRGAMSVVGALAAVVVFVAGQRLGGLATGVLASALMLALTERVMLSAHLWPDTLLSLLHAVSILLLCLPASTPVLAMLGLVVMLATLARVEQLALGAGVLLVLAWRDPAQVALNAAWVFGPCLLALAFWTLRSWRRYGVALPDTTWLFNLRILERQLANPATGPTHIEGTISALLQGGDDDRVNRRRLTRMLLMPLELGGSILRRLCACFGPDTFVGGRLIPPLGSAYSRMPTLTAARLSTSLRWSFPLIAAVALWACVSSRHLPEYLPGAIPTLLSLIVVHFRTRYRLVLMPWICLAAAESLLRIDPGQLGPMHVLGAALLLLGVWMQVRHPAVVEHDGQIRPR